MTDAREVLAELRAHGEDVSQTEVTRALDRLADGEEIDPEIERALTTFATAVTETLLVERAEAFLASPATEDEQIEHLRWLFDLDEPSEQSAENRSRVSNTDVRVVEDSTP